MKWNFSWVTHSILEIDIVHTKLEMRYTFWRISKQNNAKKTLNQHCLAEETGLHNPVLKAN